MNRIIIAVTLVSFVIGLLALVFCILFLIKRHKMYKTYGEEIKRQKEERQRQKEERRQQKKEKKQQRGEEQQQTSRIISRVVILLVVMGFFMPMCCK
jgi:F0F1-type ATP synthase membrane subunit b/b'